MLTRLAWLTVRRRRLVLALSALFVVAAAALGSGAFGVLEDGGFEDPGAESTRAADVLEDRFDDRRAQPGPAGPARRRATSTTRTPPPTASPSPRAGRRARRHRRGVLLDAGWGARRCGAPTATRRSCSPASPETKDAVVEDVHDLLGGRQGVLDVTVGGPEAVDDRDHLRALSRRSGGPS